MPQKRRGFLKIIAMSLATIGLTRLNTYALPSVKNKLPGAEDQKGKTGESLKLGAFSVSLNVKDLAASKQFYENLGFHVFGGSLEKHYLIMKNEHTLIGIFHGMFEKTMLTFNPGWDDNAKKTENPDDIREIQRRLKAKGIKPVQEADETTSGPASFIVVDPDGNTILFDQHI